MKTSTKCIIGFTGGLLLNNGIQAQTKPNLLFIMTDQQRFDAMSIAGNTILKTPNLDRLANAGARFKNAYTQCAVSGPARATILTGRTVENHGVISNDEADSDIKPGTVMTQKTFDQILTEQGGYRCEYYGKWHSPSFAASCYKNPVMVSTSGRSIFDGNGDVRFYKDNYLNQVFPKPPLKPGELYDNYTERPYIPNILDKRYGMTQTQIDNSGIAYAQPDFHGIISIPDAHSGTAYRANNTIEALERLKDTPFSITCSFHFPHAPMLPSQYYFDMFPVNNNPLPVSLTDPMSNSPYFNSNSRNAHLEYRDPQKIKYMISEYYALIKEIDDWVGKILDKLDELGLSENTMVIFTSDHGEMLGAHGMREKNNFLEESAHIPLLIKFPGRINPGTIVNGNVSNLDLFATICDYFNMTGTSSDGKSLRGLMDGTDQTHGKFVVTEWFNNPEKNPGFMILKDGYKMYIPFAIESPIVNALHNLNTDPHEMTNLIGSNPNRFQYFEKVEELRADLLSWLTARNSKLINDVKGRDLMKSNTSNAVIGVTVDSSILSLGQTMTKQLTAKVWPTHATNKGVSWSSSNSNVATVSSTGLVTAIGTGNTTITVTTAEGAKKATIAFTVTPRVILTGVSVSPAAATFAVGVTQQLDATVTPSDANNTVSWTSNNTNVATVNSSGMVTGVATGNATITANTAYDGKTATSEITIVPPVNVSDISIAPATASVQMGGIQQLTATIAPADATFKGVTWSSNNTSVATVNSDGLVSGLSEGVATITGTTVSGGKIATSVVTIIPSLVFSLTLQAETASIKGGEVATNQIGFKGTGFVDFQNQTGDYITWTANVPATGTYSLSFRYALAAGSRPLSLSINGIEKNAALSFSSTGSFATWSNAISIQLLNAGDNTITLATNGSNGPNVDEVLIERVTASAVNNLRLDLESQPVLIYPNPLFNDILKIKLNDFKESENIEVIITNLQGRVVYKSWLLSKTSNEINLSGVPKSAIYILTVRSGQSIFNSKLVIY